MVETGHFFTLNLTAALDDHSLACEVLNLVLGIQFLIHHYINLKPIAVESATV